jgi:hypothetical protein
MALAEEDIQFIKDHLGEWLAEQSLGKPPAVYEIELRERMVRVEEELRRQRELMRQGFAQMDKRFGQVDKRFESRQADPYGKRAVPLRPGKYSPADGTCARCVLRGLSAPPG